MVFYFRCRMRELRIGILPMNDANNQRYNLRLGLKARLMGVVFWHRCLELTVSFMFSRILRPFVQVTMITGLSSLLMPWLQQDESSSANSHSSEGF